jgi:hypothetical protein
VAFFSSLLSFFAFFFFFGSNVFNASYLRDTRWMDVFCTDSQRI